MVPFNCTVLYWKFIRFGFLDQIYSLLLFTYSEFTNFLSIICTRTGLMPVFQCQLMQYFIAFESPLQNFKLYIYIYILRPTKLDCRQKTLNSSVFR